MKLNGFLFQAKKTEEVENHKIRDRRENPSQQGTNIDFHGVLQALEPDVIFEEYNIYLESYDPDTVKEIIVLGNEKQNGIYDAGFPVESYVVKVIKDTDPQSNSQEFQNAKLAEVNGPKILDVLYHNLICRQKVRLLMEGSL